MANTTTKFELNKSYNYTTIAPIILGGTFKNQKVKAILTAEEAIKYRDITTLHETMKTTSNPLPLDVNDLTYLLFETIDADTQILALEYIEPYSIELVSTINVRIDLLDTEAPTIAIVRARLKELGIQNFNIYAY